MWGDECVCWLDRGNLFTIHTIQKYNKQFLCEGSHCGQLYSKWRLVTELEFTDNPKLLILVASFNLFS